MQVHSLSKTYLQDYCWERSVEHKENDLDEGTEILLPKQQGGKHFLSLEHPRSCLEMDQIGISLIH